MERVVITGMGAITPVGNDVPSFWESLKTGKCGIGPITKFDVSDFKVKLGAEVKDFDPTQYMEKREARRADANVHYAMAAAVQAVEQAGLKEGNFDPYRTGVIFGSGVGGLHVAEQEVPKLLEKGPGRVSPFAIPEMIANIAAAYISMHFGFKGENFCPVSACATGNHSIGEAMRAIQHGEAEVMVAGGTESCITPLGVAGFSGLTALSTSEDPERASIPFDLERNGFVMGEGAGVVVLEELEHAKARGAKIYAELAGYGATGDAYHITSPAEDGSGAAKAMEYAIADAGMKPEDIDYINAHGTATHHNDLFETKAIKLALGDHAYKVKINSTKSMIGHLLGAAGGVEFIDCVKSIQDGFVHATAGLKVDDPECDLDYTKGDGVSMEVKTVLTNSLGFGGHNACLLVRKFEE